MIYLILAAFLAANIAALVSIAAWYRRDRDDLVGDNKRLRTQLASAERDAEVAEERARRSEERRQGAFDANVQLARTRREADDEVFRVTQEFREHLDGHACLPTLNGIRGGLDVGDGPEPPLSLAARGVVVPLRKAKR
jgi:hypothetical protein